MDVSENAARTEEGDGNQGQEVDAIAIPATSNSSTTTVVIGEPIYPEIPPEILPAAITDVEVGNIIVPPQPHATGMTKKEVICFAGFLALAVSSCFGAMASKANPSDNNNVGFGLCLASAGVSGLYAGVTGGRFLRKPENRGICCPNCFDRTAFQLPTPFGGMGAVPPIVNSIPDDADPPSDDDDNVVLPRTSIGLNRGRVAPSPTAAQPVRLGALVRL